MTRKQSRELIARLNRDAERIARHFRLEYLSIEAERGNVTRRYGICYSDGTIRIRLRHVVSGKPLKYSSLVNTLCHELAHLRHFNHGLRFREFYRQLLEWARAQRIYQPSQSAPVALPQQAGLTLNDSPQDPRAIPVRRPPPVRARPRDSAQTDSSQTDSKVAGEQLSLFS